MTQIASQSAVAMESSEDHQLDFDDLQRFVREGERIGINGAARVKIEVRRTRTTVTCVDERSV